MSLSPDDAYLTYCEATLMKEDIVALKGEWLTDNVITFWEEYLENEYLSNYNHSNIVLLRPSMSLMLMLSRNPEELKGALPDLTKATHIFLPVNDCHSATQTEEGSHWSLLLVSVVDGVAFHYDSMPPGNVRDARQTTAKLSRLLQKPLRFQHLEDSPTQENGSDCGVFVCLNMRHLLLKRLLRASSDEQVHMSMGGSMVDASEGRKEMLRIIEDIRREAKRRSSRSSSPRPRRSRSPPRLEAPMNNRESPADFTDATVITAGSESSEPHKKPLVRAAG